MTLPDIRAIAKGALRYAIPVFGAIWLFWTALEIKYFQGWFDAQDDLNGKPMSFHFPAWDFLISAGFVLAGFVLIRLARPLPGNVLALGAAMYIEMLWLGYTR